MGMFDTIVVWKELEQYKIKHKKTFSRLMKKYTHETIACRNWQRESFWEKSKSRKMPKKAFIGKSGKT